jgi:CRISPR/Cas system-associated endonuclease Cas3-HD
VAAVVLQDVGQSFQIFTAEYGNGSVKLQFPDFFRHVYFAVLEEVT